jgi:N-acetylmuramoyl-L-alanine amidase
MGKMLKKITIIFFLSLSLFASSLYLNKVHSYDKQMRYANESEMLRIFHSLQNIYIKSIINNDDNLKEETLKRLVKSSKILHFDARSYEKELANYTDISVKKPIVYKIKKKSKKSTKVKLVSFFVNSNYIKLTFNSNIDKKSLKIFTLAGKKYYRKIFDFTAYLSKKPHIRKPRNFQDIKLAQYNKKTMRLVLQTKKAKRYYLKYSRNILYINFNKPKKIFKTKYISDYAYNSFNPKNKIIVLDPGHGGKDSGAIGYKRRYEKRAVLAIALKCAKELKKKGYKVYLTRSRDVFIQLRNRTSYANRKHADLFISIHANAAPKKSKYLISKGLETFFLSPDRSKRSKHVAALENRSDMADMDYYSKNIFLNFMNREKIVQANKMALDVQQGILKSLRTKYRVVDGGVREAPFWVLVGAQMPAILIEAGYITNPTEGERLFNFRYQELLAKGIVNGVDNYFLKN